MSELTSSTRSIGSNNPANITAESVKMFMKSVNRIRFNSLTATNNMEASSKKIGGKHRSRSCPQFPKIDSMSEEDEEVSRSASTTYNDPESETAGPNNLISSTEADPPVSSHVAEHSAGLSVANSNSTFTMSTKQETTVTITSTTSTEVTVNKCPMYTRTTSGPGATFENRDCVQILRQALNASSSLVCSKCQGLVDGTQSGNKYMYI